MLPLFRNMYSIQSFLNSLKKHIVMTFLLRLLTSFTFTNLFPIFFFLCFFYLFVKFFTYLPRVDSSILLINLRLHSFFFFLVKYVFTLESEINSICIFYLHKITLLSYMVTHVLKKILLFLVYLINIYFFNQH